MTSSFSSSSFSSSSPSQPSTIPLPKLSDDPAVSAIHPAHPWPWTPPVPPSSSSDLASPTALELVQVHYYIRHGERTPVRTRLAKANPPIPERWPFCHTGAEFRSTMLALTKDAERQPMGFRRGVEATTTLRNSRSGAKETQRLPQVPGECLLGELTDVGRQSTLLIGKHLRDVYVRRLGLLPARLSQEDDSKLYVRSTNMSRTIETAMQVCRGVMGLDEGADAASAADSPLLQPQILVRNGHHESLLPNTYSCPTLYALDSHFSSAVAAMTNPSLAIHDPILTPHLSGAPLRVDGHPRLSGVLDTIRAAKAHGLPTPREFEKPEVAKALEGAVVNEWFSGYNAEDEVKRQQYRRLAMGPLLNDLAHQFKKAASSSPSPASPAMAIYSTHDTTLAGMLSTLDTFDIAPGGRRWPAFTASVGVELWKLKDGAASSATKSASDSSSSWFAWLSGGNKTPTEPANYDGHYVRLLYNGQALKNLPWCQRVNPSNPSQADDLCPLDDFLAKVSELRRGNEQGLSWEEECELGRKAKSSK